MSSSAFTIARIFCSAASHCRENNEVHGQASVANYRSGSWLDVIPGRAEREPGIQKNALLRVLDSGSPLTRRPG